MLIHKLKLRQPDNGIATSQAQAIAAAEKIGYPVVIRPSYVLGGRAMQIVYDREAVERYMRDAVKVSGSNPVLIDSYLRDAIEVVLQALNNLVDDVVDFVKKAIEWLKAIFDWQDIINTKDVLKWFFLQNGQPATVALHLEPANADQ